MSCPSSSVLPDHFLWTLMSSEYALPYLSLLQSSGHKAVIASQSSRNAITLSVPTPHVGQVIANPWRKLSPTAWLPSTLPQLCILKISPWPQLYPLVKDNFSEISASDILSDSTTNFLPSPPLPAPVILSSCSPSLLQPNRLLPGLNSRIFSLPFLTWGRTLCPCPPPTMSFVWLLSMDKL